jgi:hypothetical protein
MELSPSSEGVNCAATQEFLSILWNPKVHYRVHKSPPLVPFWATSIQSIPSLPISLRSILILSTHLRLGLPGGLFPSGFLTNILYCDVLRHWIHTLRIISSFIYNLTLQSVIPLYYIYTAHNVTRRDATEHYPCRPPTANSANSLYKLLYFGD